MPIYICENCVFETTLKGNYKQHLNTKKHLKNMAQKKVDNSLMTPNDSQMTPNDSQITPNDSQITPNDSQILINDSQMIYNDSQMTLNDSQMTPNYSQPEKTIKTKKFVCPNCSMEFTRKNNLIRHLKLSCKSKNDNEYKELYEKEKMKNATIQAEKDELFKKIDKLISCVGNTTNITNNIVLNCFGNEDLSHITDNYKTKLLKIPYEMIPRLIEAIHFNHSKPENNNIYLPNKKQPFVKIYKDSKWVYESKKETINKLINNNYGILEQHYVCKGEKELNNLQKDRYNNFKDNMNDPTLEYDLGKKCELLILNNKLETYDVSLKEN